MTAHLGYKMESEELRRATKEGTAFELGNYIDSFEAIGRNWTMLGFDSVNTLKDVLMKCAPELLGKITFRGEKRWDPAMACDRTFWFVADPWSEDASDPDPEDAADSESDSESKVPNLYVWTESGDRVKVWRAKVGFGSAGGIITVPYYMQRTENSMRGLEKLPLQRRRELLRTLPTRGPIKATVCLHERCLERDEKEEKEEKEVVRSIKLYARRVRRWQCKRR